MVTRRHTKRVDFHPERCISLSHPSIAELAGEPVPHWIAVLTGRDFIEGLVEPMSADVRAFILPQRWGMPVRLHLRRAHRHGGTPQLVADPPWKVGALFP